MTTRYKGDQKMKHKEDPGAGGDRKSLGIFCWDRYPDILPLAEELLQIIGCDALIPLSPDYESDWSCVEGFSTVIIICSSQRSAAPETPLRRFLNLCFTHASENMILVITDLEDSDSQKRKAADGLAGEYGRCPLMTLTGAEMDVMSPPDRADASAERRMAGKVIRMSDILRSGSPCTVDQRRPKNKSVVGIFSRQAESDYSWLVDALRSDVFMDDIAGVRPCHISNSGHQQFWEEAARCTYGILYHSKNRGRINVTDVSGSLYDEELEHLSCTLGKKNVIVVVDDLSDSSDQQKTQILMYQPSIREMAEDLFLISHEEKTSNYQRRVMVDRELRKKLQTLRELIRKRKTGEDDGRWTSVFGGWKTSGTKKETIKDREDRNETAMGGHPEESKTSEPQTLQRQELAGEDMTVWDKWSRKGRSPEDVICENNENLPNVPEKWFSENINQNWSIDVEFSLPVSFSKKSVGIFSRSSEREYIWLKMLLESEDFSDRVRSVRSCYVSNDFSKFSHDVSDCEFGILYHTKNRGRVNVTNVTDSLYDEELEHLSCRLGKKNVVVMIDDLEDTSDAMKEKLLSTQHSIKNLAQDLILVKRTSPEEKMRATKDTLHLKH